MLHRQYSAIYKYCRLQIKTSEGIWSLSLSNLNSNAILASKLLVCYFFDFQALDIMNITRKDSVTYSFFRKHPLHGQEYVTGIETKHRKPNKSKATRNTITQVISRRPFDEVEFREDTRFINTKSAGPEDSVETFHEEASAERVNFILSLAGRYSTFLNFMKNFENVCLKNSENVSLTIILFRNDPNDTSADVMAYVTRLKQMYNESLLSVAFMKGSFSRGVALQNSTGLFQNDDLLFFVDVDLEVETSTLQRIRLNTMKGQAVYAPIFFSHYDPQYLSPNISSQYPNDAGQKFDSNSGYWRQHSFGMISTYKSDLDHAGGYKQDIKGWGLEDIDLLEKFISSNVEIFRSVDVGLLHRFHPINCDRNLEKSQYKMCIGTKMTTSSSAGKMAEIVYHTPEIFNRNNRFTKSTTSSRM